MVENDYEIKMEKHRKKITDEATRRGQSSPKVVEKKKNIVKKNIDLDNKLSG